MLNLLRWHIPGNAADGLHDAGVHWNLHVGLRCGSGDHRLYRHRGPLLLNVLRRHIPADAADGLHDAGMHHAGWNLRGRYVLQCGRGADG